MTEHISTILPAALAGPVGQKEKPFLGDTNMTTEELVPTSKYTRNHWHMLKERGWGSGTKLQAKKPDRDGKRQTTKIDHIKAFGNNVRLNSEGNYDVDVTEKDLFGKNGIGSQVITVCEWPIGGKLTAISLNCRDWEEIQ